MGLDQQRVKSMDIIVKKFNRADIQKLQEILERSSDYFQSSEHRMPTADEAENILKELPEGKTMEDKILFGVYSKDTLIGIIDYIRNYPDLNEYFLGLMIIDPQFRGKGIGRKAFEESLVLLSGARSIVLCTEETNSSSLQFWKSRGFVEYERKEKLASDIPVQMIYFRKNLI